MKRTENILCAFFIIVSILIPGCVSYEYSKALMQVEKFFAVGGKYLLHDNPQTGDYAQYKLYGKVKFPDAPDIYLFEKDKIVSIHKIEKDEVFIREDEITRSVKNAQPGGSNQYAGRLWVPIPRRIVTDMKGNIKRVYTIQSTIQGYRFKRLAIAVPGDDGYITWTPIEKTIPVTLTSKKVPTKPVWFKKTSRMHFGTIGQVNTVQNTWETNYINRDIRFLTAMNLTVVFTELGMHFQWDEYALVLVNSLIPTNIFSNPVMSARNFVKEGLTGFLKSAAKTTKDEAIKAVLRDERTNNMMENEMNLTVSYYLTKHGNILKEGKPLQIPSNYPEPDEFRE